MMRFLSFIIFLSGISYAQIGAVKKIDSLLSLSANYEFKDGLQSLKYAKQASILAESINDNELLFGTYLQMADCLYTLDMFDKSLEYIKNIEKKNILNNPIKRARLKEVKSNNFEALGLDELNLKELNEILEILSSNETNDAREIKARVYAYLSNYYEVKGDFKKADEYINKTLKLNKEILKPKPIDTFIAKAYICLALKKTDSAFYFINKSFDSQKVKGKYSFKYTLYMVLADYYYYKENYPLALINYQKTLNDMASFNIKDTECSMMVKEKIYKIYGKLNDRRNEQKYLNEFKNELSTYNHENNKGLQKAVNLILDEKDNEKKVIKKKNKIIFFLIGGLSTLAIAYLYLRNRKIYKRKRDVLVEKEKLIKKNRELEGQKKELNKKAYQNQFNELISLAKNNNPEFLILFEEMYPIFTANLKQLNPHVRNSELFFCALAFMNFSTKEISNYTFVSVAAVQLRKHRIRKKYNIPSHEDFNTWMKSVEQMQLM
ncbi:helix-turn-helix transcriptional regulator [Chryseobacterium candidae]|uniref:Tetratricopeptide repeat protein n=1 Tax=Chryseobacterium candidae TaxID=1978493 RepID=A0ABY2R660_9FLAO|nr:hypothetical protein [Chryseobacterium candidae]THV58935.1 hypothetical protein EK417_11225 [Chryseobacterium candidae]